MRISSIETFMVDAGWRPWIFVRVETDEGVTGYGECSDGRSPHGVVGTIEYRFLFTVGLYHSAGFR